MSYVLGSLYWKLNMHGCKESSRKAGGGLISNKVMVEEIER